MRDLAVLKTTGQQRLALLVADIGEVLAGHTDAGTPGLLQTIHEVPFLFRHRSLPVSSTSVLPLVRGPASRTKTEDSGVRKLLGCQDTKKCCHNRGFAVFKTLYGWSVLKTDWVLTMPRSIGYARCSTTHQDTAAQTAELRGAGCVEVFAEKVSSRAPLEIRHQLPACLEMLQKRFESSINQDPPEDRFLWEGAGRTAQTPLGEQCPTPVVHHIALERSPDSI